MATSAPNVPIEEPVYQWIDKLVAFGLIKDVLYGQRPWSRSEIARLIGEAMTNRDQMDPILTPDNAEVSRRIRLDDILDELGRDYREELIDQGFLEGHYQPVRFHPLRSAKTTYTFLDSELRAIPDNGLGTVDALIEPLTAYKEGRRYPDGHQLSLETEHWIKASSYSSFYARPRFQFDITHDGNTDAHAYVQQLYGKFEIWNTELEVGRDSVEWGQGKFGGIILSNNARPLDMIKLSNPSPTILPWIFKYMGPFRYTFFVANLGPEREFPYSYLTGLKISAKPVSFFELGIDQILVLGGEGSPGPLTVGNAFSEFFGKRPNGSNLSNRELGFDFRFWLPRSQNTQIYLDVQFEDRDLTDPTFMFTNLANYQAGLYIPSLNRSGTMDLRLEYRHGSPFFYRHGSFTTGMALNEHLLGDELGPQGDSAELTFSYDETPQIGWSSSFKFERRDGDILAQVEDAVAQTRRVDILTPMPEEKRVVWETGIHHRLTQSLSMAWNFGYERIGTFNFVQGDNRNAFLFEVGLKLNLY